jgi:1,4-alpha-glucan branching enzyme
VHFAESVRNELSTASRTGSPALVTTFDTELFGHWWYEGVEWLSLVLRDLAGITSTAADVLRAAPPSAAVVLREGSWGKDNDHSTWLDQETRWMWHELDRMARALAALGPTSGEVRARAARQAVRELLLAQSSDWPFLVTTGQAAEYASERFRTHRGRFDRALAIARHATAADESELRTLERVDDLFPEASLAGAL